jgi:hypothetical protein
MSSNKSNTAEKIFARLKGLRNHMQPAEEPLFSIPAIWDSGRGQHSMACDVVLTNQRLLGYVFVTFPRERLFLEAITLARITAVSFRQKTYEPIFRELLVSDGQQKVYIRAPRQKIEALYQALRSAIERYAPAAEPALGDEQPPTGRDQSGPYAAPVYGRQEIRTTFERSPLAITLLFVGGLILEIGGAVLWAVTHSAQTGFPLFIAGVVAVITATLVRRQRG